MLTRVLEPEIMETEDDAREYDDMDHSAVNRVFVEDFRSHAGDVRSVLDVGAGTAQIPIELGRQASGMRIHAVDGSAAMIALARRNIAVAGLDQRVEAILADAKSLPFPDASFDAVMSNSIVHHIPDPRDVLVDMIRVGRGCFFVRDLLRPETEAELLRLVDLHAAGAKPRQRQLFADSLRAALSLAEIRGLIAEFGFPPDTVRQTTDRHWTWAATRKNAG